MTVVPAATAQVSHVSGQVLLTGTMTCNRAVTVALSGTLNQRLNRTTLATGSWSVGDAACGPTPTRWSATVVPNGSIPFGQGNAQIDGTYSSFDPVFQINVSGSFSQGVKLGKG